MIEKKAWHMNGFLGILAIIVISLAGLMLLFGVRF